MNREEFKQEYRIWRAAASSIQRAEVARGLTEDERKRVWHLFWVGLYERMPKPIYRAIIDKRDFIYPHESWGIASSSCIHCNMEYLPNSWPRTDVRNR